MHVSVLSWSLYGGGRARALLSLCDHLSTNGICVSIVRGEDSWSPKELDDHHDIHPDVDWVTTAWDNPVAEIDNAVGKLNPDVVISWDTILNTKARHLNIPTVGYCRTQYAVGLDEYWSPSRHVASQHSLETRPREDKAVKPVYPTWYIEQEDSATDRPIDILVHGRKTNGVVKQLNPVYNILLANRFSYPELRELYRQTKLFLFPRPERYEPLGLMPIEARAHGCNIAIPENSGVAEIYPNATFENPCENIETALDMTQDRTVPESPTNVIDRLKNLA